MDGIFAGLIKDWLDMMKLWYGSIFHITGPLLGESTSDWWIKLTKDQWYAALMISLLLAWTSGLTNSWVTSDFRYDDDHVTSLYRIAPPMKVQMKM